MSDDQLTVEGLRALWGQMMSRVIVNKHVPKNTIYLFSPGMPRPPGWETMTTVEQVRWAAEHGWTIVVHGG